MRTREKAVTDDCENCVVDIQGREEGEACQY